MNSTIVFTCLQIICDNVSDKIGGESRIGLAHTRGFFLVFLFVLACPEPFWPGARLGVRRAHTFFTSILCEMVINSLAF
jgi:uncharacterized membrane protein YhaH (DUF805 family)